MSQEKIKEAKKLIRVYEIRKEQLKADYERNIADIDSTIAKLKIELADAILEQDGAAADETEDLTTLVTIRFDSNGKRYDYIWDSDQEVNEGDAVKVECKWGGSKVVEVVSVTKVNPNELAQEYKCAYPV